MELDLGGENSRLYAEEDLERKQHVRVVYQNLNNNNNYPEPWGVGVDWESKTYWEAAPVDPRINPGMFLKSYLYIFVSQYTYVRFVHPIKDVVFTIGRWKMFVLQNKNIQFMAYFIAHFYDLHDSR